VRFKSFDFDQKFHICHIGNNACVIRFIFSPFKKLRIKQSPFRRSFHKSSAAFRKACFCGRSLYH
jgi:hypothetical protein